MSVFFLGHWLSFSIRMRSRKAAREASQRACFLLSWDTGKEVVGVEMEFLLVVTVMVDVLVDVEDKGKEEEGGTTDSAAFLQLMSEVTVPGIVSLL